MIIDDEWDNVLGQVFYAKGYIRGFPGAENTEASFQKCSFTSTAATRKKSNT